MPKRQAVRRIDQRSGLGRASEYAAGATVADDLADHSHDGTEGSGGILTGYAAIGGTPTAGNIVAWDDALTVEDGGIAVVNLATIANVRKIISLRA